MQKNIKCNELAKKIGKNKTSSFIKFDIVVIYSSKTEKLLDNSNIFAKHHTTISDYEINIFSHSEKAVLFDSNDISINMNLLVYIYQISYLSYYARKLELYQDNGLAVAKNANGAILDKFKKRDHYHLQN